MHVSSWFDVWIWDKLKILDYLYHIRVFSYYWIVTGATCGCTLSGTPEFTSFWEFIIFPIHFTDEWLVCSPVLVWLLCIGLILSINCVLLTIDYIHIWRLVSSCGVNMVIDVSMRVVGQGGRLTVLYCEFRVKASVYEHDTGWQLDHEGILLGGPCHNVIKISCKRNKYPSRN